jgi:hypothetical protein
VLFKSDCMYNHRIVRFNYTTYDVRRSQDVINPRTSHCDIMLLADPSARTPSLAIDSSMRVSLASITSMWCTLGKGCLTIPLGDWTFYGYDGFSTLETRQLVGRISRSILSGFRHWQVTVLLGLLIHTMFCVAATSSQLLEEGMSTQMVLAFRAVQVIPKTGLTTTSTGV